MKANSDGSGSGDIQDDARLLRVNPISPEISGDTWRSLEPANGSAPDATCPTQGVIDAEPMDSSTKAASDPLFDGTGPIPMSIDTQDPDVGGHPCEVPVPSSPSATHSWTPLYEQHCGPSRGDAVEPDPLVTDLKRPRSPSFAQEKKKVKRDALQVSFVANKH